jgi:two-component system, chemotaxis family, response regulator PixG
MLGSLVANDLEEQMQAYREQQFTGLVKVNAQHGYPQHGYQWVIYYLLGRIVWTKSRVHSLRRWQRHLSIHNSVFSQHAPLGSVPSESWNYPGLARLVKLQQFRYDPFCAIVESCIAEDLFDILQVGSVQQKRFGKALAYEAHRKDADSLPFVALQHNLGWQKAQQEWLTWEQAGLAQFSPDWAPIITQLETLREQSSPQTFQTLTTFVDGKTPLRDLAHKFKQPIISLTKSILPYVSRKMLGLLEIPDLVSNVQVNSAQDGFDAELLAVESAVEFKANSRANSTANSTASLTAASTAFKDSPVENQKAALPGGGGGGGGREERCDRAPTP